MLVLGQYNTKPTKIFRRLRKTGLRGFILRRHAGSPQKLGYKGFYVVADVANLPFRKEAFDGIVSLHTIHHLPIEEKGGAYIDMYHCLKPGGTMVTVDGWGGEHKLYGFWQKVIALARRLRGVPKQSQVNQIEAHQATADETTPKQTDQLAHMSSNQRGVVQIGNRR